MHHDVGTINALYGVVRGAHDELIARMHIVDVGGHTIYIHKERLELVRPIVLDLLMWLAGGHMAYLHNSKYQVQSHEFFTGSDVHDCTHALPAGTLPFVFAILLASGYVEGVKDFGPNTPLDGPFEFKFTKRLSNDLKGVEKHG